MSRFFYIFLFLYTVSPIACECPCGNSDQIDSGTDSDSGSDSTTESDKDSETDAGTDSVDTNGTDDTEPPDAGTIDWVQIDGGTFIQGRKDGGTFDETPEHEVSIKTFFMMKNEVIVSNYRACVNANVCETPMSFEEQEGCNWGVDGRDDHPINCVNNQSADAFCKWIMARLPSESEWEFAATSRGDREKYFPWGWDDPTCELAAMRQDGKGIPGCGLGSTMPVCSKPNGNTEQGLCDMAGNVDEWMPDWYRWSYNGDAPTDGGVWDDPTNATSKVIRGGSYDAVGGAVAAQALRCQARGYVKPFGRGATLGFRCAKSK